MLYLYLYIWLYKNEFCTGFTEVERAVFLMWLLCDDSRNATTCSKMEQVRPFSTDNFCRFRQLLSMESKRGSHVEKLPRSKGKNMIEKPYALITPANLRPTSISLIVSKKVAQWNKRPLERMKHGHSVERVYGYARSLIITVARSTRSRWLPRRKPRMLLGLQ